MKWLTLVFLAGFLALFIYVSADLSDRADPNAPGSAPCPRTGGFLVEAVFSGVLGVLRPPFLPRLYSHVC